MWSKSQRCVCAVVLVDLMPINCPRADEAQVGGVADSRVENVTLDFDDLARFGDYREGSDLVHDLGSATYSAEANRWHSFSDTVSDVG